MRRKDETTRSGSEVGERLRVRMRILEAGRDVQEQTNADTHKRFKDVVGFIPDLGQRERHGAKTLKTLGR